MLNRRWIKLFLVFTCMLLTLAKAEAGNLPEGELPLAAQITVEAQSGQNAAIYTYSLTLAVGENMKVDLVAAGGTGYQWQLENPQLNLVRQVFYNPATPVGPQPAGMVGGPVRTSYVYQVKEGATGGETLRFQLIRSWEKPPNPAATAEVIITVR